MPFITSCVYDELLPEDNVTAEEPVFEGEALKFFLTVDEMGGDDGYFNPNKSLENYIDPDKVRVLFFTDDDKFLFESKSRWVKRSNKSPHTGFYTWEVLVPFFTHGNDQVNEYDWYWDDIREYITQKPFKIAILANRPEREWNMGIMKKGPSDWMSNKNTEYNKRNLVTGPGKPGIEATWGPDEDAWKAIRYKEGTWFKSDLWPYGRPLTTDTLVQFGWFGNHGPYWTKNNTYKMDGSTPKDQIRDVFDLHHCQYDPIYDGKNWDNGTLEKNANRTDREDKDYTTAEDIGFYNNIAEMHLQEGTGRYVPWMGATSSWVNWGDEDNIRRPAASWSGVRYASALTEDHPIPMYGIQRFAPLDTWEEGTTFNLGRIGDDTPIWEGEEMPDKAISLLRSVVKLELVIPSSLRDKLDYVVLSYTNVYARCEPVDTWTPTNEIWSNDHDADCEWKRIQKYGPVAHRNANDGGYAGIPGHSPDGTARDVLAYQKRISWFYGAWLEKLGQTTFKFVGDGAKPSGFTPNDVPSKATYGDYPRIFNSCIQRNNNVYVDPTTNCWDDGLGNLHYIVYMGEKNVNDPTNLSNMGSVSSGSATQIYWQVALKNNSNSGGDIYAFPIIANPRVYNSSYLYETGTDGNKYPNFSTSSLINESEILVASNNTTGWPLVRNHVYRMYTTGATRSGIFGVRGEMTSSPTIDFNKVLFHWSQPNTNVEGQKPGTIFRK